MNEKKQWVQHVSGVGEKWEMDGKGIVENETDTWAVIKKDHSKLHHYLPKSEYRLCEPPEEWKDVTEDCSLVSYGDDLVHDGRVVMNHLGYRLRKVPVVQVDSMDSRSISIPYATKWAFIVEKKVSQ